MYGMKFEKIKEKIASINLQYRYLHIYAGIFHSQIERAGLQTVEPARYKKNGEVSKFRKLND